MEDILDVTIARKFPDTGSYVVSNIKRRDRRTKAEMIKIRNKIREILSNDHPQTIRQAFYALTVKGVIAKIENEYQRTAVRLIGEMREDGELPFEWIADNTRWMRKPSSFTGLADLLHSAAHTYRRNLWAAMPVYVEREGRTGRRADRGDLSL